MKEKLMELRQKMKEYGMAAYLIVSDDFHASEYVGEYFKCREYISGFNGSAGTLVITEDMAGLWTDGRYFIQAEEQLAGTGITLFRSGQPGVVDIGTFLAEKMEAGTVLGFDGRTVSTGMAKSLKEKLREKKITFAPDRDVVGEIWVNRPALSCDPIWELGVEYAGESRKDKVAGVRKAMVDCKADYFLIPSLDEIAWLFNIRGNDIAYCPLVLSYAIVYNDSVELFADTSKFSDTLLQLFAQQQIILHPYEEIYDTVSQFNKNQTVLLDSRIMNYSLYRKIPEFVPVVDRPNPEILMKCIKNDVQVENLKAAHLKDGIAHTRFMYWLKTNSGEFPVTELSASQKLEEFRAMQDEFIGPSFAPISAYGEHGAIVHYSADEESNVELKPGKLFMTDTGGHYLQGSTDITRTVAIGEAGQVGKEHFTLVVRAMLRLANTVFLHGCSGANLDCIAREVFWKRGLNFNHGTGHGVGYLLNIHEGPINFRWKEGKTPSQTFEKNMVITDEPGLYIKNSHGIRIENELLVTEADHNEYGQFMKFEVLTLVPIDLDALLPEQMTFEEREQLNNYHQLVYKKISPYLPEAEKEWLKHYTRAV